VTAAGVRYSFTGAITEPCQVLPGGYLSWHDPVSDHWFQQTWFGASSTFRDLGIFQKDGRSLREMVDALTPQTKRLSQLPPDDEMLSSAVVAMTSSARRTHREPTNGGAK
jgi:hypothetical protein